MPDALPLMNADALQILLAPIVIVSAIGGMLLGLQRGYTGVIDCVRSLNARRRAGENTRAPLCLMAFSARLHATAIAALYLAAVWFLLCACTLGLALLKIAPALAQFGFICFLAGAFSMAAALLCLLRDVPLWLRALDEELTLERPVR